MLKRAFGKVFAHKWRLDAERTRPSHGISLHSYYACLKTGDRKVVTRSGPGWGYQPIDKIWLQSGSGVYYVDGKKVDTQEDPSLLAKPLRLPPPARKTGLLKDTVPAPAKTDNSATIEAQRRLRELSRQHALRNPS